MRGVDLIEPLGPQTPFLGSLKDFSAALKWMADHVNDLGIDSDRIVVADDSAGADLAAALAQMAHDRSEVDPCFRLLVYPMLDDRTVLQANHRGRSEFVWTLTHKRLGWTSYLGHSPRLENVPEDAAPARRQNLKGVAPAWTREAVRFGIMLMSILAPAM